MYEHVTRFIDDIEQLGFDQAGELADQFTQTLYEPEVMDQRYREILDGAGLEGGKPWHANVEALDLRTTLALLTFVHRAEYYNEHAMQEALQNGFVYRILLRLRELDGGAARPNVVTFYHEYDKDGYLSNWYASPFTYGGRIYPTSEHWMMWQKACVFGDWDMADRMLRNSSPARVKQLGKKVQGFSDDVWNTVDVQLMRVGLRQKFLQNTLLMNLLLSTGSAVLGEAAGSRDAKWGVGYAKSSPKLADPANWYGQSLLGRTLMDVRADLRGICSMGGELGWPIEALRSSHVWRMNLLELSRVPSMRTAALAYATIAAHGAPGSFADVREVLRNVRDSIGDIHDMMLTNMGGGLPVTGWYELLDELALQVRLGRL